MPPLQPQPHPQPPFREAMNRGERIPTLHELKLAGRVERARALFGPGGYLGVPERMKPATPRHGPAAAASLKHPEQGKDEGGEDDARSTPAAFERLQRGNGDGDATKEGSRTKEDSNNGERSLQSSSLDHARSQTKIYPASPRPTVEEKRPGGIDREGLRRRVGRTWGTGGAVTTVTLTIVGGRPKGRGFTNLEQSGKVPCSPITRALVHCRRKQAAGVVPVETRTQCSQTKLKPCAHAASPCVSKLLVRSNSEAFSCQHTHVLLPLSGTPHCADTI